AVDPLIVQLMGERGLAVLVVENDGLGRGNVGPERCGFDGRGLGCRRGRGGWGRGDGPDPGGQDPDENHTENNLEGAHLFSVCHHSKVMAGIGSPGGVSRPGWEGWYLGITPC